MKYETKVIAREMVLSELLHQQLNSAINQVNAALSFEQKGEIDIRAEILRS